MAEERKSISKVVKGQVSTSKKGVFEKFKDVFLGEATNVGEYIFYDIVVPAIKNALNDTICMASRALFGGRPGNPNMSNWNRPSPYIQYSNPSQRTPQYSRPSRMVNGTQENDKLFQYYEDAEAVLSVLNDQIREYGNARLSDLYDALEESCPYTYKDVGWYNLSNAVIEPVPNGYVLRLPRVQSLKK